MRAGLRSGGLGWVLANTDPKVVAGDMTTRSSRARAGFSAPCASSRATLRKSLANGSQDSRGTPHLSHDGNFHFATKTWLRGSRHFTGNRRSATGLRIAPAAAARGLRSGITATARARSGNSSFRLVLRAFGLNGSIRLQVEQLARCRPPTSRTVRSRRRRVAPRSPRPTSPFSQIFGSLPGEDLLHGAASLRPRAPNASASSRWLWLSRGGEISCAARRQCDAARTSFPGDPRRHATQLP